MLNIEIVFSFIYNFYGAFLRINKDVKLPYSKIRGAFKIPLSNKETVIKI